MGRSVLLRPKQGIDYSFIERGSGSFIRMIAMCGFLSHFCKLMKHEILFKQVRFARTVTVGQTVKMTWQSEVTGQIKDVTMHFPPGCNALVDIAFGISGDRELWLCPSEPETYVALDSATPQFAVNYKNLRRDDILWVWFRNRDSVNSHSVSVLVDTEGYLGPE